MIKFICVTGTDVTFSMSLVPVTNREALQARLDANETPAADLLEAGIQKPHETNWPALWARARELANGCQVYAESMWRNPVTLAMQGE